MDFDERRELIWRARAICVLSQECRGLFKFSDVGRITKFLSALTYQFYCVSNLVYCLKFSEKVSSASVNT